jgi:Major Facilitator Superfamily
MRRMSADKPRLPRAIWLLGLASFFTDASSEMILPLLPALMLGTLGATPLWLGAVDGVADAVAAVIKLKAGQLSDQARARKPFVLAGYGISTLARPLVTFALSPVHVVLVRALDRVGKGIRSAPRDALLADAVDEASAPRAFALHRAMDHAGAVVGPLIAAGLLALGLGVRDVIAWAWLPGGLALVALLLVREAPRAVAPAVSSAAPLVAPLGPQARRFLIALALFGAGALPDTFLLVRARELGAHDAALPLVWVVLHVAKMTAAGVIARRAHTDVRVLGLGWLVVGAGACSLVADAQWVVWAAAVIVGVGHGVREPLEKEVVRASTDARSRGRAFGRYHLVSGFASLAGGLAIGGLWTVGGVAWVAPLFAATSLGAVVLVWSTLRPQLPRPETVMQ